MTDDFVQWLTACLDEDEQVARRNIEGRGLSMSPDDANAFCFPDYRTYSDDDTAAADEYIEHFNPARVLLGIDGKRQLLAEHAIRDGRCRVCAAHARGGWARFHAPCPSLRLLARDYADRPGYREEWRP